MQFIIYDFEVFAKDWLVVFKKADEVTVIKNDRDTFVKYYEENKSNIFVGFNNKHYDDYIFKAILSDIDPKRVSDFIILKEQQGWSYPGLKNYTLNTFDVKQDLTGNLSLSLKEAEGNMGLNIEESEIDFNITRKLTDEEIESITKYCKHDVFATEQILLNRKDDISTRLHLLKMFDLPISNIGKTNAKLTAIILKASLKERNDELLYNFPSNLKVQNEDILKLYDKVIDYQDTLVTEINNVEHTIAYGGLHGAKKGIFEGNIWYVDVASYYPSLMLEYDYISRNIKDKELYRKIYTSRLEYKKIKDPRESGLKLVLNTMYGAMKNKFNALFDPHMANHVCITGQLLLIDLLEKLEPYSELLQSNTDGIMFISHDDEKCKEIVDEWQSRTRMSFKIEKPTKLWQKDVNNYILLKGDDIEVKGGYVKYYKGGKFTQNTTTIIDTAVVNFFVHGIPVETTINNCNELMKFQYICKKGPTYKDVYWIINSKIEDVILPVQWLSNTEYDSFKIDNGEAIKVQNCNRVFASKNINLGKLFKLKEDGRRDSIAGLPDHCIVVNEDLSKTKFSIDEIDKEWYIKQAKERINDFLS